jgi:hypothetical protein
MLPGRYAENAEDMDQVGLATVVEHREYQSLRDVFIAVRTTSSIR